MACSRSIPGHKQLFSALNYKVLLTISLLHLGQSQSDTKRIAKLIPHRSDTSADHRAAQKDIDVIWSRRCVAYNILYYSTECPSHTIALGTSTDCLHNTDGSHSRYTLDEWMMRTLRSRADEHNAKKRSSQCTGLMTALLRQCVKNESRSEDLCRDLRFRSLLKKTFCTSNDWLLVLHSQCRNEYWVARLRATLTVRKRILGRSTEGYIHSAETNIGSLDWGLHSQCRNEYWVARLRATFTVQKRILSISDNEHFYSKICSRNAKLELLHHEPLWFEVEYEILSCKLLDYDL